MNTETPSNPNREAKRVPRLSRLFVFLVASVLTLLALAWAVENWRGARAWSAARRELLARGEPLSIDQLVPPLPPPEQNFATTPLLRGLFDYAPRSDNEGSLWLDPKVQAQVMAISMPATRVAPAKRGRQHEPEEWHDSNGKIDLAAQALGVRLMPRNCPPHLSPALAERYGYLPPGTKWKKPTNELEIAASIRDPAQEVLEYLQRFDLELQEIAQAVRRPHSQFAVHWAEGSQALLPHLGPIKQLSTLFSVRASARLQKQNSTGAFDDTITCLRLAQAQQTEPLLISQLVHMAVHNIAVKTVREGLVAKQWNAEQIKAIQSELAPFNFQQGLTAALRGERVLQNEFLDHASHHWGLSIDTIPSGDVDAGSVMTLCGWVPGWTRQNQVRLNRYDDLQLRQVLDQGWPTNLMQTPDHTALLESVGMGKNTPYSVLARLLAPDLTKAQVKAARAQTVNRRAIIACALERYRLEQGGYPQELAELTPRYLSEPIQDPMNGAPFQYNRSAKPDVQPFGYKLW